MKVYEYQAKQLLDENGIQIPRGAVASTPEEAASVARELGGSAWVIKAQIHAGGRRAGHFVNDQEEQGGVRFVSSLEEVRETAQEMLGHVLVTNQTGPDGSTVNRLYVEQLCGVQRELYLGMLVDRRTSRVTLVALGEGGVNIGSITSRNPESVLKIDIDPLEGLQKDEARNIAGALELTEEQTEEAARIMLVMYSMFMSLDASLIEINPLAVTTEGTLLALGAAMTFDDNAMFRQETIQALRDDAELRWGELDATQHGLNYVKLDGNVGCLASGAGLAMATLDAVKFHGGEPANFLDVPPAVEVEHVKYAVGLILSDPDVEAILVNVFGGGIMRCDTIADGIILAAMEFPVQVPLIVRLAGVNSEFAIVRLRDSGLVTAFAEDIPDAAEKVIKAATEARLKVQRKWWQRVHGLLTGKNESVDRTAE
ncbi:MAG: ADP-forming succinate--CoA ligase subunit beta [Gammaproteobacteria bacterium]|nr:MAG: ADP-forming succinate--CoA ligase subunit beta [Gammaproteobacteria bacterium]